MEKGISPDPKNRDEEYIKVEMIIHKKWVSQKYAIDMLKRCRLYDDRIRVEAIAVTGIEAVDENIETNDVMNAAIKNTKSEIVQERLGEGQDIIAEMFFKKHPIWIVVTNCPKCGTPNINLPCKRCGYDH